MEFKTKPYKHQLAALGKLYGHEFGALFMEQGTGKSKVAIDMASGLFGEGKIDAVLLIAPNGVHRQWADEQIPLHSSVATEIQIWNRSGAHYRKMRQKNFLEKKFPGKLKWFCVNVDAFSTKNHILTFREYVKNHNCMVIVDEATRIKNPGANRTTNILYNLASIKKRGKKVVGVQPFAKYRFILTGMMVTNSPYDLWAMFEFLQHDYFGCSYFAFKSKYGVEVRDTHPGTGRMFSRLMRPNEMDSIRRYAADGKDPERIAYIMSTTEANIRYVLSTESHIPYKRMDELRARIQADSYIVRKDECLDLPPKIYEHIDCKMNSEQKRVYKELVKQLLAEYNNHELTVANKISLVGRLQQVTGGFFPYVDNAGKKHVEQITPSNPKIDALVDDIEETGEEVIIVWAVFTAEIKMIVDKLTKKYPDKNIEAYYGATSAHSRSDILNRFKSGGVDILVANARTAGIGLNLQRSTLHYFYSNTFSLEDRLQAEDRSHRSGQTSSVVYKDIIVKGTVDEKVYEVLKRKRSLLDYFRDTSIEDILSEGDG